MKSKTRSDVSAYVGLAVAEFFGLFFWAWLIGSAFHLHTFQAFAVGWLITCHMSWLQAIQEKLKAIQEQLKKLAK